MNRIFKTITLALFIGIMFTACDRQNSVGERSAQSGSAQGASQILADITQHNLFTIESRNSHGAPTHFISFNKSGDSAAYIAEKDGLRYLVHNNVAGKSYQQINNLIFSPDGQRLAYSTVMDGKARVVLDGKEGGYFESVDGLQFSADGKHLLYYAGIKGRYYLVVDEKVNSGAHEYYDQFFSADSNRVISFSRSESNDTSGIMDLTISDLKHNTLKSIRIKASNRIYNSDKSRMAAVSESEGRYRVLEVPFYAISDIKEGPLFEAVDQPVFGSDNVALAYIAQRAGKRYLIMNGKEAPLPEGEIKELPLIKPGNTEVAVIIATPGGYLIHHAFGSGTEKIRYEEVAFQKYSKDGATYAFAARNGTKMFYVVNGTAGPSFDLVLAPVVSADGKYVVGRVRKDGKRFVIVLDSTGKLVSQHAPYEMVFDPQFTADGKSVSYGVKDGSKLIWKVEKLP